MQRTANKDIKRALMNLLESRGSIRSEEAYAILKEKLNVSEEELAETYVDEKGHTRKVFEMRIMSIVEQLRKTGFMRRWDRLSETEKFGIWEKTSYANLKPEQKSEVKATIYLSKDLNERINTFIFNTKQLKDKQLNLLNQLQEKYNTILPTSKTEFHSIAAEFYFDNFLKPIISEIENTSLSAEDVRKILGME
ncbi:hypothetical protein [Ureibacillus endophyticus]|uniref:Uncharacterized protein n=1 Tax=Ureibacillus endophyticus TaxID=1978490 RepID=A0A494YTJ6_9BACL|nr:hypothetical protein [Lysinibacillus endophyticus]RKQ13457.1 hypothetical protein D8M03_16110 [Lysinibacillus endophyticus]